MRTVSRPPSPGPRPPAPGDSVRFVVLGDLHATDLPPASRDPAAWAAEQTLVLNVAESAVRDHRAEALLCTGDLFHRKAATTHRTVATVAATFAAVRRATGRPVYTVLGNHDLVGNNTEHARACQPVAVLESADLIRLLDAGPVAINSGALSVALCGASFAADWRDAARALRVSVGRAMRDAARTERPAFDAVLALTHADAPIPSPVAGALAASAAERGWAAPRVAVFNGHLHDARGVMRLPLPSAAMPCELAAYAAGAAARVSVAERDLRPRLLLVTVTADAIAVRGLPVPLDKLPAAPDDFRSTPDAGADPGQDAAVDAVLDAIASGGGDPSANLEADAEAVARARASSPAAASAARAFIAEAR